jgi:hypothetical protein
LSALVFVAGIAVMVMLADPPGVVVGIIAGVVVGVLLRSLVPASVWGVPGGDASRLAPLRTSVPARRVTPSSTRSRDPPRLVSGSANRRPVPYGTWAQPLPIDHIHLLV